MCVRRLDDGSLRRPARNQAITREADGMHRASLPPAEVPAGTREGEQMMNGHDVSILSEDASLSGRISAQDLTILGGFQGDVVVRGRLRIGPKAKVNAKVKAESVEVEGTFEGEIRSTVLSFAPSAHARGLFLADRLGIRDGAVVEGAF